VTKPVYRALRMRAFDRLVFIYGKRRKVTTTTARAILHANGYL
jgi:hypothetical protein